MILGQRLNKFQNTLGNKLVNTVYTLGNKYVDNAVHKVIEQHKPKIVFSDLERYNNRKKMLSQ
jgi:hypothetical protein